MEKPKCRLCGIRHRNDEPHWLGDVPKEPQKPVEQDKPSLSPKERTRLWREKNAEKNRLYMKEYMRKRRKGK